MPYRVDKPARLLQQPEAFHLDRGMADHTQELLVRPYIGLERRDVQIADCDHRTATSPFRGEPRRQLVEKPKFMRKFWVLFRIRQIAACWDVDVVELDSTGQLDRCMAAIGAGAPGTNLGRFERNARQNGDAVIPL